MDPKRNDPPKNPQGDDKKPKNLLTTIIISIAILLVVISVFNMVSNSKYTETTYSDFLSAMEKGDLSEVELHYDRVYYLTKTEAAKPASQQKPCFTGLPTGNVMALAEQLNAAGVQVC